MFAIFLILDSSNRDQLSQHFTSLYSHDQELQHQFKRVPYQADERTEHGKLIENIYIEQ